METRLTTSEWIEILQNQEIMRPLGLKILQVLYNSPGKQAAAKEIGKALGVHFGVLNLEVGRIGRRIAERYIQLELTKRENQKYKFWDIFFDGVQDGALFDWILRPELAAALEQTGLATLQHNQVLMQDEEEAPELTQTYSNQSFGLERYLQEFLIDNWDKLSLGNEWSLYRDEEENVLGVEYPTDIGRIDLLAKHRVKNEWLVVELKRDKSADVTVGQVLRYIGWIKENLADENDVVRGLIISRQADDRLYYALSVVPNVTIQLYEIDFRLVDSSKPLRK